MRSCPCRRSSPATRRRLADWGGITVGFEKAHKGQDASAMLRGLPDDRCQAPHWGYLFSGRIVVDYGDRQETIVGGAGVLHRAGPHAELRRGQRGARVHADRGARGDARRRAAERRRPRLASGRAQNRVEQSGEALVELGAAQVEELPPALLALADDAGAEERLEMVARRRLRDGDLDGAAAQLPARRRSRRAGARSRAAPGRRAPGWTPSRPSIGVDRSGRGSMRSLFDSHRTIMYGADRTIAKGAGSASTTAPTHAGLRAAPTG